MGEIKNIKKLYFEYQKFYKDFYGIDRDIYSFRSPIEQILKTEKYIPSLDSKILEYGCGSGFNIEYLYGQGYKNVLGIEQNPDIFNDYIKSKNKILIKNQNFINSNIYREEEFDFIFTRAVLQQKVGIGKINGDFNTDEEVIKILKNFNRILNPKGILILNEGKGTRDWKDIFNKSNFRLDENENDFFKLVKI
jgi:SAM-dependent methyltransferase